MGGVTNDFLWLPVCGLIAICNQDSDASVQAAQHASPRDVGSFWKERRDGGIQLNRLASNSFERALEADDDSLSMESPQPVYRRSFTRASSLATPNENECEYE